MQVFKKAEKNRAVGYTGLSQRTRQRQDKGTRDQAACWEEAKILCVFSHINEGYVC